MPRRPEFSLRTRAVLDGEFGRAPVTTVRSPIRLHIGDSDVAPGAEFPLSGELDRVSAWWYRYPAPAGTGRLRRALADYYVDVHGLPTEPEQILVVPGATAGLNTLVHLLCDPGDEVLVPTPAWPLFPGMVRLAGADPVEVAFHNAVARLTPEDVERRLESAVTPRTVALYLNTPNNPAGTLMDDALCRAALDVAERNGLWVISDEAYDGMVYDGRTTPSMAGVDPAAIVVSTASKMHRAAGLRIGWIRADEELVAAATRIATFQNYSASAAAQALLEPTVGTRADWAPAVIADLQERRDRFIEALDLQIEPPAGTYFAFLDLGRWFGEDFNASAAVTSLSEAGVFVTPGGEFGRAYRGWLRACFASESLARTVEAAGMLGRWIRERGSRQT
jgi:N-succinyldiaminopimelate aminotransferase